MKILNRLGAWALLGCGLTALTACERPPHEATQVGHRGVAMEQLVNQRIAAKVAGENVFPASILPPAEPGGQKAAEVYQNVQVLKDLNVAQFTRLMLNITAWVSPEQGCNYCHTPNNLADDSLYTKKVARRMLEMTRHVNNDWTSHVKDTGVTCYTCHRGQPVPSQAWFDDPGNAQLAKYAGDRDFQNNPSAMNGETSLPNGTNLLSSAKVIRVGGKTALPIKDGPHATIADTETTYGLMMYFSEALGVNCTYCHNSRAFSDWSQSTPKRTLAWHGIQMARNLNTEYVLPLTDVLPAERKGPTGDIAKVGCATCHHGVNKPLLGAPMLVANPELKGGAQ